jgi:hypothetical protein
MGAERLGRLQPSIDPRTVADLLAHTTEAARFLAANGALPLRASEDLPQIFAALAVEGRALEALRLLALAAFLESLDESRTLIRRAPGTFPLLEAISAGAATFKTETAATRDKITLGRGPDQSEAFATGCKQRNSLIWRVARQGGEAPADQVYDERVLAKRTPHRDSDIVTVVGKRRKPVSRTAQHG